MPESGPESLASKARAAVNCKKEPRPVRRQAAGGTSSPLVPGFDAGLPLRARAATAVPVTTVSDHRLARHISEGSSPKPVTAASSLSNARGASRSTSNLQSPLLGMSISDPSLSLPSRTSCASTSSPRGGATELLASMPALRLGQGQGIRRVSAGHVVSGKSRAASPTSSPALIASPSPNASPQGSPRASLQNASPRNSPRQSLRLPVSQQVSAVPERQPWREVTPPASGHFRSQVTPPDASMNAAPAESGALGPPARIARPCAMGAADIAGGPAESEGNALRTPPRSSSPAVPGTAHTPKLPQAAPSTCASTAGGAAALAGGASSLQPPSFFPADAGAEAAGPSTLDSALQKSQELLDQLLSLGTLGIENLPISEDMEAPGGMASVDIQAIKRSLLEAPLGDVKEGSEQAAAGGHDRESAELALLSGLSGLSSGLKTSTSGSGATVEIPVELIHMLSDMWQQVRTLQTEGAKETSKVSPNTTLNARAATVLSPRMLAAVASAGATAPIGAASGHPMSQQPDPHQHYKWKGLEAFSRATTAPTSRNASLPTTPLLLPRVQGGIVTLGGARLPQAAALGPSAPASRFVSSSASSSSCSSSCVPMTRRQISMPPPSGAPLLDGVTTAPAALVAAQPGQQTLCYRTCEAGGAPADGSAAAAQRPPRAPVAVLAAAYPPPGAAGAANSAAAPSAAGGAPPTSPRGGRLAWQQTVVTTSTQHYVANC
eukprot:TRINITY_DN25888_c0_g1_i2.p1 TRINITY_DN25888_c0_g1~~TRINITY_DN25888_c0_g1_i2.p1  ORF type:complete len:722 (+),score=126.66 TRINITY_DN25888_c0_g1_i2:68-2233(+)